MSTRITTLPVTCNLDHIQHNGTFVALPTNATPSTQLVMEAIGRGATTIVLEKDAAGSYDRLCEQKLHDGIKYVLVPSARRALASRAARAHGYPSEKMTVIAVSGRSGRQQTAKLLAGMLADAGNEVATLNTDVKTAQNSAHHAGDFIQQFLAECIAHKMTHVVIEVGADQASLDNIHNIIFSHVVLADHNDAQATVLASRRLLAQCGLHAVAHLNYGTLLDRVADDLPLITHVAHAYDVDRFFENGLSYQLEKLSATQVAVRVYDQHDNVSLLAARMSRDIVPHLLLAASVARQCQVPWAQVARAVHQATAAG